MEKKILPVLGMACAGCSANVERRLKAMDGMKSVAVSLPGRTAMVEYDESKVTPADMKKVVDAAGFELIIDEETRFMPMPGDSWFIAQPIWTRLWRCPQPSRSSSASSILFGANSSGEHVA